MIIFNNNSATTINNINLLFIIPKYITMLISDSHKITLYYMLQFIFILTLSFYA